MRFGMPGDRISPAREYNEIVPSIQVQLDDATCRRLDEIANGKRTEFVEAAVKDAIRRYEYARTRAAYREQPDSEAEADDWSNCEDFKP